MFLFVQARIAKKDTLPFSRDLHKISILSAFTRNIDESRTPMHEPPRRFSLGYRGIRETGSSRFNERHHKGEIVIFTAMPDFAVPSLVSPLKTPFSPPCCPTTPPSNSTSYLHSPSFCSILLALCFFPTFLPSTCFRNFSNGHRVTFCNHGCTVWENKFGHGKGRS